MFGSNKQQQQQQQQPQQNKKSFNYFGDGYPSFLLRSSPDRASVGAVKRRREHARKLAEISSVDGDNDTTNNDTNAAVPSSGRPYGTQGAFWTHASSSSNASVVSSGSRTSSLNSDLMDNPFWDSNNNDDGNNSSSKKSTTSSVPSFSFSGMIVKSKSKKKKQQQQQQQHSDQQQRQQQHPDHRQQQRQQQHPDHHHHQQQQHPDQQQQQRQQQHPNQQQHQSRTTDQQQQQRRRAQMKLMAEEAAVISLAAGHCPPPTPTPQQDNDWQAFSSDSWENVFHTTNSKKSVSAQSDIGESIRSSHATSFNRRPPLASPQQLVKHSDANNIITPTRKSDDSLPTSTHRTTTSIIAKQSPPQPSSNLQQQQPHHHSVSTGKDLRKARIPKQQHQEALFDAFGIDESFTLNNDGKKIISTASAELAWATTDDTNNNPLVATTHGAKSEIGTRATSTTSSLDAAKNAWRSRNMTTTTTTNSNPKQVPILTNTNKEHHTLNSISSSSSSSSSSTSKILQTKADVLPSLLMSTSTVSNTNKAPLWSSRRQGDPSSTITSNTTNESSPLPWRKRLLDIKRQQTEDSDNNRQSSSPSTTQIRSSSTPMSKSWGGANLQNSSSNDHRTTSGDFYNNEQPATPPRRTKEEDTSIMPVPLSITRSSSWGNLKNSNDFRLRPNEPRTPSTSTQLKSSSLGTPKDASIQSPAVARWKVNSVSSSYNKTISRDTTTSFFSVQLKKTGSLDVLLESKKKLAESSDNRHHEQALDEVAKRSYSDNKADATTDHLSDVSTLIQQRIAANKNKKPIVERSNSPMEDIFGARSRLKNSSTVDLTSRRTRPPKIDTSVMNSFANNNDDSSYFQRSDDEMTFCDSVLATVNGGENETKPSHHNNNNNKSDLSPRRSLNKSFANQHLLVHTAQSSMVTDEKSNTELINVSCNIGAEVEDDDDLQNNVDTIDDAQSLETNGNDNEEKEQPVSPRSAIHAAIMKRMLANRQKEETISTPNSNKDEVKDALHAALLKRTLVNRQNEETIPTPNSNKDEVKDALHAALMKRMLVNRHKEETIATPNKDEDPVKDAVHAAISKRSRPPTADFGSSTSTVPMVHKNLTTTAVPDRSKHSSTSVESLHNASSLDDPALGKYYKMLKFGLPLQVVHHSMKNDGLDPSMLTSTSIETSRISVTSVSNSSRTAPVSSANTEEPLIIDPKYKKYYKMLNLGIPREAVKHSIVMDGLDPLVLDGDQTTREAGATAAASNNTISGGAAVAMKAQMQQKAKDTVRRMRIHWETMNHTAVPVNSVWAMLNEDVEEIYIDETEFKALFQAENSESKPAARNGKPGFASEGKVGAVKVIDAKRANNGGIILARMKMGFDEVANAIEKLDETALTPQQLQNLAEYLPTVDEASALKQYAAAHGKEKIVDMCECEKFMIAMLNVRQAKNKIRCLFFKQQFPTSFEQLQKDAATVERACDELFNSVRLRKLLGIVLNIGNKLNTAGAGQRKANAFTLESLLKLNEAKAFDKKTTVLHYVVLVVRRNNEFLTRFADDLPTVLVAGKIHWEQCLADLDEVEHQLENIRKLTLMEYRLSHKNNAVTASMAEDLIDESMSLEDEFAALRSSKVGLFTLETIKKVSSLRDKVELTQSKFSNLLEYFGEPGKRIQANELFEIIVTFCGNFKKANIEVIANEKAKAREERKKNTTGQVLPLDAGKEQISDESQYRASPTTTPKPNMMLRLSAMQPHMAPLIRELESQQKKKRDMQSSSTRTNIIVKDHQLSEKLPSENVSEKSASFGPNPNKQLDQSDETSENGQVEQGSLQSQFETKGHTRSASPRNSIPRWQSPKNVPVVHDKRDSPDNGSISHDKQLVDVSNSSATSTDDKDDFYRSGKIEKEMHSSSTMNKIIVQDHQLCHNLESENNSNRSASFQPQSPQTVAIEPNKQLGISEEKSIANSKYPFSIGTIQQPSSENEPTIQQQLPDCNYSDSGPNAIDEKKSDRQSVTDNITLSKASIAANESASLHVSPKFGLGEQGGRQSQFETPELAKSKKYSNHFTRRPSQNNAPVVQDDRDSPENGSISHNKKEAHNGRADQTDRRILVQTAAKDIVTDTIRQQQLPNSVPLAKPDRPWYRGGPQDESVVPNRAISDVIISNVSGQRNATSSPLIAQATTQRSRGGNEFYGTNTKNDKQMEPIISKANIHSAREVSIREAKGTETSVHNQTTAESSTDIAESRTSSSSSKRMENATMQNAILKAKLMRRRRDMLKENSTQN